MRNVTVFVSSINQCETLKEHLEFIDSYDPVWRQTVTGCTILRLLKDIYKFNVSYVPDNPPKHVTMLAQPINVSWDNRADVFARSMSLTTDLLDHVYPIFAINTWRFGFIFNRINNEYFTTFYSKPFSRPVWNCLYAMAFLISFIFYFLKRWEFSVIGGWQTSYAYESLMVIGAYCQHIPPIDPKLLSRRIAYFIFFVFAYIVYTFYTSNLLSNLVNDKDHDIDLDTLAESDYEFVIVDYMKLAIAERNVTHQRIGNTR
ncbi:hypothetical protein PYW08_011641 [Mythimna loreyi]|uniref:Uncharacterized protein n=1 Tax=Mythimna loreyi TaxID=667449 RepID=A0ACC2QNZ6_9NEOP|nr:hypothetical protein PYW08_011641 [Mythimna loreyi]